MKAKKKRRTGKTGKRNPPQSSPPEVPLEDPAAPSPEPNQEPRRDPEIEQQPESRPEPQAAPPGSSAGEILNALRHRLAELLPGWASRPEDPAHVLMEMFAESAGELRDRLFQMEELQVPLLLEKLGLEPRPPRPARGVVAFEPTSGAFAGRPEDAITIPAGTPLVAQRTQNESGVPQPRIHLETEASCRIGPARLARVFSIQGSEVREIPIESSPPGSSRPSLRVFGDRIRGGRELYLGDQSFLELRQEGATLRLDWPEYPAHLAKAYWEYRVAGGWRSLPVLYERQEGNPPVLRMLLSGPLPDFASELLEQADLPWIRCTLGSGSLDLAAPVLTGGGVQEEATGQAGGRPVARTFLEGAEEILDFSFEPRLQAPEAAPDLDPAIYFGWDGPSPSTIHFGLDASGPGETLSWRIIWEYSRQSGWEPIQRNAIDDRTGGFIRPGTITLIPPEGWESRGMFGERLWWVRARWVEGERAAPLAVSGVIPRAVEVVQGRTVEEFPLGRASEIQEGILALPPFAEGEVDGFDRLEVRQGEGTGESWDRVRDLRGCGPEDARFELIRNPRGRLCVRFGDGRSGRLPPRGDRLLVARGIRIGIGSQGNLPAGTRIIPACDLPGIASVRNPLSLSGGEDIEPLSSLRARASAEWRTGGRAVTAKDYECHVRARLPGIARVITSPDPRCPGGILVVPVPEPPRTPGRFSPALLRRIEEELSACAPLGTPVRVSEPSYLQAVVEIAPPPPEPEREHLRARILEELRSRLESLFVGGFEFSGTTGLNEALLRNIITAASGEKVSINKIRLLSRDGQSLLDSGFDLIPDLVLEIIEVQFADDEGGE